MEVRKHFVGKGKNMHQLIFYDIISITFVENLLIDTGVATTGELEILMLDIMVWSRVILDPRAAPADPP